MFEELLELYRTKLAEKKKDLREYQAMVQLATTVEKMSQKGISAQSNVALLKKLEDEVNRQCRELRSSSQTKCAIIKFDIINWIFELRIYPHNAI